MAQPNEAYQSDIFDVDRLSADERRRLIAQCNDAYVRKQLRKLRALILFAQSEPETIPAYDEDTGIFGPTANFDAINPARSLAVRVMECPDCSALLREFGWTDETPYAKWGTMLDHLPADRLHPLPWPGE